MLETTSEVLEIYLQPGESYLARKPAIIRTILGSCVGATFWSARLGIGALTHSQLPWGPRDPFSNIALASCHRYVDLSIRDIARQLDALGADRAEMQVKLFGGADVLLVSGTPTMKPSVGKLNCEAALEVLLAEGFHIKASSLGGTLGLKLRFDTRTGEVRLRRLA
jgi:chemotaxis receptor (MCP) glutamine deamidase CheD